MKGGLISRALPEDIVSHLSSLEDICTNELKTCLSKSALFER